MEIAGSGIHDPSVRFRMYAVTLVGIAAFGAVLYWRMQLFYTSEYFDTGEPPIQKERRLRLQKSQASEMIEKEFDN